MTKDEYIKNIEKLNYYTKLYDEGNPEISDEAWDTLYFDCKLFEEETGYIDSKSPTATIQYDAKNSLKKVTHNHPMLSLDKTRNIDVLRNWLKESTVVMHKMDGLTCSLKYINGNLVSAETRGNGKIGEDITENVKRLPSVPKKISIKTEIVIDGEVICKYDDFEEFSDLFKNPRNFAAGSIRLLNADECEKRKLTFVAWDIISTNDDFIQKLDILKQLGFTVIEHEITDLNNLEIQQDRMKKLAVTKNYPIDGLVYRINNGQSWLSKGRTEHAFRGSFAFKFVTTYYNTHLIDIEWSVAKSGIITPVAIFESVNINGASVKRASMHNLSIMKNILGENPYKGQPIQVCLANEIIPQLKKINNMTED